MCFVVVSRGSRLSPQPGVSKRVSKTLRSFEKIQPSVTNPSVLEPNKVLSSHFDILNGSRSSVAMRVSSHSSGNRERNSTGP